VIAYINIFAIWISHADLEKEYSQNLIYRVGKILNSPVEPICAYQFKCNFWRSLYSLFSGSITYICMGVHLVYLVFYV